MFRSWVCLGLLLGVWTAGSAEPVAGSHLTIGSQGFYSFEAKAGGEASVALVDRQAGTLATLDLREDAGSWTARTALLLEPGDYQIRWTSKDSGITKALEYFPYPLSNAGSPDAAPVLSPLQSVRTNLKDRESAVYQVTVAPGSPRLSLEVRGRSLSRVVLWKDGLWDMGLNFQPWTEEPVKGHLFQFFDIDQDLPPGHYQIWIFGGPRIKWADESVEDPLVVTRDPGTLPENGIREGTLDGEGRAEWILSPSVRLLEVETQTTGAWNLFTGSSRATPEFQAKLGEKEPLRLLTLGLASPQRWVVVRGSPGGRYRLRGLPVPTPGGTNVKLPPGGILGVTSSPVESGDGYPATGVAVCLPPDKNTLPAVSWEQTLDLGPDHPLRLQTNNQSESSFLVHVRTAGTFAVVEKGVDGASAEYRFTRLDDLALGLGTPAQSVRQNGTVNLQDKIYMVTSSPVRPGRNDWALVPAGVGQGLAAAGLWGQQLSGTTGPAAFTVPQKDRYRNLRIILPGREGVPDGVTVLPSPVDAERIPTLPLGAHGKLLFRAVFPQGRVLSWSGTAQLFIDGDPFPSGSPVPSGEHLVEILTQTPETMEWAVGPPTGPLAPAPLPGLKPGDTLFADWDRNQTRSFELQVPAAGLYRIETLGRLSMTFQVRTPLHPGLFQAVQDADGGNSFLYAYLNPGTYRVQVSAGNGTRGRAGLSLALDRTLVERTLFPGTLARATVPGGKFLKITVSVPVPGEYQLTSSGLRQDFTRRFEDPEGYPVDQALAQGGGQWKLTPGTYTLYSYPLDDDSRRIYGLENLTVWKSKAMDPRVFGWNQTVEAVWKETLDRTPQEYRLTADAPVHAQVILDDTMVFEVLDSAGISIASGAGGDPVSLDLPEGPLLFKIRSRAVNNFQTYHFAVRTLDLTPGRSVVLVPSAPVPVSVGHDGTYELSTWGRLEIPLYLYQADGKTLEAKGSPRTDDWNSILTVRLKAGRYLLNFGPFPGPVATAPPAESSDDTTDDNPSSSDDTTSDDDNSVPEPDTNPTAGPPAPVIPSPPTTWTEARFPGDLDEAPLLTFQSRPEIQDPAVSGAYRGTEAWGSAIHRRNFTTGEAGVYRFGSDAGRLAAFRLVKDGKTLAENPGGFLIPLPAKTTYNLESWWESPADQPVSWSVAPADGVQHWANPSRTSARWEDPRGPLVGSAGWEHPLVPLSDGWLATLGTDGWWALGTGDPLDPVSPVVPDLGTGSTLSVPLGPGGQTIPYRLPPGRVGLVTARGDGLEVGLSALPGAVRDLWNWDQARITPGSTAVGVTAGTGLVRVWNPGDQEMVRWVGLTWATYPVQELPTGTVEGTLAPGQAVLVPVPGKSLRILLDEGLTAFASKEGGSRPLVAEGQAADGILGGPVVAVVNPGTAPRGWRAIPAADDVPGLLTETKGFEALVQAPRDFIFDVDAPPGSLVSVAFGQAGSVRWADGTSGRWEPGTEKSGPGGPREDFPGAKGVLYLKDVTGFVKVWVGSPDRAEVSGVTADGMTKAVLGSGGSTLAPGPQAWLFSAPKPSFYSFTADGPGILAVIGPDGRPLASSWSDSERSVLVHLGTQPVTIVAKPFMGGGQRGNLWVQAMDPQGPGDPLLGPGERQLWAVQVKTLGQVGLGVQGPVDGLQLDLFNPDFTPAGSGALFWRALPPGTYWLVVRGTAVPVRYHPVFLGLDGSRTAIPDDVRIRYEQGTAP